MAKIRVKNPIVEMDGDEMTRFLGRDNASGLKPRKDSGKKEECRKSEAIAPSMWVGT